MIYSPKVSEGWVTRWAARKGQVVVVLFRDGRFSGWKVTPAPLP